VLLRGVNDSPGALLDLSFGLLDEAKIMPYYLYMCGEFKSNTRVGSGPLACWN
jgi:L-lysine 2,3-aminomutase